MSRTRSPEGLAIRPFDETDSDYEAAVAIWNAIWPDEPSSVEGMRYGNRTRSAKHFYQRVMAELDGEIVATAIYREPEWIDEPGMYDVQIRVLPEYQRRGIGSAHLRPHHRASRRTRTRSRRSSFPTPARTSRTRSGS